MNRRALMPALVFVAGSLLACASPLSPEESRALDEAEARWASRLFQSYAFETRVGCFCPPVMNEWSRVEVVNGSITRVVVVETGIEVTPEERGRFRTVEQLFEDIRRVSRADWVEDVTVQFDPVLGYPTLIRVDPKEGILDAGSERRSRNATALPTL